MDLRVYYRKLREIECAIAEPCAIIVSNETPDGGREGVKTEAPRSVAARMVLEGKARLATPEETTEFRTQVVESKRAADQMAAANRVQFTILSEADVRALKGVARK